MNHSLIVFFILLLPFSAYGAPENSPLGVFEGSPRHEDKTIEIDEEKNDVIVCHIPEYGTLVLTPDQDKGNTPETSKLPQALYTCLWAQL